MPRPYWRPRLVLPTWVIQSSRGSRAMMASRMRYGALLQTCTMEPSMARATANQTVPTHTAILTATLIATPREANQPSPAAVCLQVHMEQPPLGTEGGCQHAGSV